MSKTLAKDEVDLVDLILVIWKKKLYVIFFIIISFILVFFNQSTKETAKVIAITEINPITVYDEAKYKIFNSVTNNLNPNYIIETTSKKSQNEQKNSNYTSLKIKNSSLTINDINRDFLLDFFIDVLSDKDNLSNFIKKSDVIKEENYSSKIEYEKAISNLALSINLIKINKVNFIKINTNAVKDLENFLNFLEKESNLHVQIKLNELFNNYITYAEALNSFEIEDVEAQLSVTSTESLKYNLERRLSVLRSNKHIKRIQTIFNSSPISNINYFYAARINFNSTSYKVEDNISYKIIYLVAGICGAIFGIFFVLIANAIKERR